jgi:hypothetical protein
MITCPSGAQTATVATWLATAVLRGGPLPDGVRIKQDDGRDIMWVTPERTDRVAARFKALNAPLERVFGPVKPDDPAATFDPADDEWLETTVELAAQEQPAWIIVDGLTVSVLMAPAAAHFLDVIDTVTRSIGCATTILCEQDEELIESAAIRRWAEITGRMQTALAFSRSAPDSEDVCLRVSRTHGERPEPLRIRIESGVPTVLPTLAMQPKTSVDRAVVYLEHQLAVGPQPAAQLIAAASSHHRISKRSLDRAKKRLGVKSFQVDGHWHWILL